MVGFVDQSFCLCGNCGNAQITNAINPEILYDIFYHFRPSTRTTALRSRSDELVGVDPTLKGCENELSDDKITVIDKNIDLINYIHGDNTLK